MSIVDKILTEAKISLQEKVLNIWPNNLAARKKYGQEVFDLLQTSYKAIGGIHGNGFNSVEDMIKNIALWKIVTRDGVVTAVVMYKDKEGRKRVAAGTNGTSQGKMDWKMLANSEIKTQRGYGEISGAPLSIYTKQVPDLEKYAMPFEDVVKLNKGEEIRRPPQDDEEVLKHPNLKDYFYQRKIGGHWHTKVTIGKPGQPIQENNLTLP